LPRRRAGTRGEMCICSAIRAVNVIGTINYEGKVVSGTSEHILWGLPLDSRTYRVCACLLNPGGETYREGVLVLIL
jgi:hypothetical protein